MKYKCLIFDHDDTTVNSTATIHYPCFVEFMEKYHPQHKFSLKEYIKPGYQMARVAGVHFAAASWCFDVPENSAFMKANADYFCGTVENLKQILI